MLQLLKSMLLPNNIKTLVFVLGLALFNSAGTVAAAKDTVTELELYWRICEEVVCDAWILDIKIPAALQPYKEECVAAAEFDLLGNGQLKRIKIRHSNGEKYLHLPKQIWTTKAYNLSQQLDKHMIAAIEQSGPFPVPPVELNCPRHCVAVFDFRSPKLVKLFIDDGIPVRKEMLDFIF